MASISLFSGRRSGSGGDEVVKPAVSSTLILRRAPVETPDELQEAEYRHGGPSDFDFSTTNPRDTGDGTSVRVETPPEEEEPGPPGGLILNWQENRASRQTHDITVTSEDDPDISIVVQRIDQIDFIAPPEFLDMWTKATGVKYDAIIWRQQIIWLDGE